MGEKSSPFDSDDENSKIVSEKKRKEGKKEGREKISSHFLFLATLSENSNGGQWARAPFLIGSIWLSTPVSPIFHPSIPLGRQNWKKGKSGKKIEENYNAPFYPILKKKGIERTNERTELDAISVKCFDGAWLNFSKQFDDDNLLLRLFSEKWTNVFSTFLSHFFLPTPSGSWMRVSLYRCQLHVTPRGVKKMKGAKKPDDGRDKLINAHMVDNVGQHINIYIHVHVYISRCGTAGNGKNGEKQFDLF